MSDSLGRRSPHDTENWSTSLPRRGLGRHRPRRTRRCVPVVVGIRAGLRPRGKRPSRLPRRRPALTDAILEPQGAAPEVPRTSCGAHFVGGADPGWLVAVGAFAANVLDFASAIRAGRGGPLRRWSAVWTAQPEACSSNRAANSGVPSRSVISTCIRLSRWIALAPRTSAPR
jgi:hypothetical protein